MTVDLKWLLPFTGPFIAALSFRLLTLVTGADYDPNLALLLSSVAGLVIGLFMIVFVAEAGNIFPVRIGKKGETDE